MASFIIDIATNIEQTNSDREIYYTQSGVKASDSWYISFRIQPMYPNENGGTYGTGDDMIHVYYIPEEGSSANSMEGNVPSIDYLEEIVSEALLNDVTGGTRAECFGEGHYIIGSEANKNDLYVYFLGFAGGYAFENGYMTQVSGYGSMPMVLILEENEDGGYGQILKKPLDGAGYFASLEEMFPPFLYEGVLSATNDKEILTDLTQQAEDYVQDYLDKIGRDAPIEPMKGRISLTDFEDIIHVYHIPQEYKEESATTTAEFFPTEDNSNEIEANFSHYSRRTDETYEIEEGTFTHNGKTYPYQVTATRTMEEGEWEFVVYTTDPEIALEEIMFVGLGFSSSTYDYEYFQSRAVLISSLDAGNN